MEIQIVETRFWALPGAKSTRNGARDTTVASSHDGIRQNDLVNSSAENVLPDRVRLACRYDVAANLHPKNNLSENGSGV